MEESNKSVYIETNEEEARSTSEERLTCSDRLEDEEGSVTTTVHTEKDTIKNNSSAPGSEALTSPVSGRAKSSFFITDILSSEKTRVSLPREDRVLCSDENPHHGLDVYSRVGHPAFNTESFDELVKRKYGIKRSYDETDLVSEPASPVSQSERDNLDEEDSASSSCSKHKKT